MNKDNAIGFGIGFLSGAIIGGAVALLFAPKSGKETRKQIKDKASEIVDVIKEKTGGVVEKVKDAESELRRKGQAVVHGLKD